MHCLYMAFENWQFQKYPHYIIWTSLYDENNTRDVRMADGIEEHDV